MVERWNERNKTNEKAARKITMSSQFDSAWLRQRLAKTEPVQDAKAVEDESELHRDVLAYCRQKGWICIHASMVHKTHATIGAPDCTIVADRGRIFLVELKAKTGKLSAEQNALKFWAEQLGTTIHVVRSMEQFLKVIE
jgi:hypothetical protein